jgi:hypothetical protein
MSQKNKKYPQQADEKYHETSSTYTCTKASTAQRTKEHAYQMATHDMDFKEEKYMKQVLLHCHT